MDKRRMIFLISGIGKRIWLYCPYKKPWRRKHKNTDEVLSKSMKMP